MLRAQDRLLRSDYPFVVPLESSYPPGLLRVNPGRHSTRQALILSLWASLLTHVGLFPLTMVKFVCVPTHRHLLAGVARLGSELTRFSSRFPRLITILTQGDDAFPRSLGVGDYTQRRIVSCQGSV